MKMLPAQEQTLKNAIRNLIALDPLISIRSLQNQMLRQTGHSISDKYLNKLVHKVRRQVVIESDRKRLQERFGEVKERFRVMMDRLWLIVFYRFPESMKSGIQPPTNKEITEATKTLAQMELALMRMEIDVGLYEDRRNAIEEMLREGLLPAELHEQITVVFRKWKFEQAKQVNTFTK